MAKIFNRDVIVENLTVNQDASVAGTLSAETLTPTTVVDSVKTVAATATLTAADSGKTIFFGHATEFVMTLPSPAAGLNFKFICTAAPSSASYTIVTAGSANIIKGTVHSSTGGNAASLGDGDTVTFADGAAVAGDMALFDCDGTNWFVHAFCDADAGITITKAS